MYKILVVDDEPRVNMGIKNVLMNSALNITYVETALNGFEAMDYLRMDSFDLVLTDIQMSRMSGIELMETIYMEQPHLPIIVISAHEKFVFAKESLRLGARDYLIKPVELDELIRVVGNVLREKEENRRNPLEYDKDQSRPADKKHWTYKEVLMELVTEKDLTKKQYEDLAMESGSQSEGCYYGVIVVRVDLSQGGFSEQEITLQDRKLLKYASINVMEECLLDWHGVAFRGFGNELIGIIHIDAKEVRGQQSQTKTKLYLIGQMLTKNLELYLNVDSTIGISTLHEDLLMLPKLTEEAAAASAWRRLNPANKVFYFADSHDHEKFNFVEWMEEVDDLMRRITSDREDEFAKIDPELIIKPLLNSGQSEDWMNSYFGMLVYRIYGLLLEYGQHHGISLHQLDPDVYFFGMSKREKFEKLYQYLKETGEFIRQLLKQREHSLVERIMSYIQKNFKNPSLKIQAIAEEVHFSAAYVSYLFKKEMNRNIWDMVTELRINEARSLLVKTDMRRYEIAYEVGYESPEHFSRMFKRYVGMSPAEYRREGQGD